MCQNYFFLQQTFTLIEFPYSVRSCNQKKLDFWNFYMEGIVLSE